MQQYKDMKRNRDGEIRQMVYDRTQQKQIQLKIMLLLQAMNQAVYACMDNGCFVKRIKCPIHKMKWNLV